MIGGLFSSTFLTLLVIPILYSLVDGAKIWFGGLRRQPAEEPGDEAGRGPALPPPPRPGGLRRQPAEAAAAPGRVGRPRPPTRREHCTRPGRGRRPRPGVRIAGAGDRARRLPREVSS